MVTLIRPNHTSLAGFSLIFQEKILDNVMNCGILTLSCVAQPPDELGVKPGDLKLILDITPSSVVS